jgi:hypothetical protein
MLYDSDYSGGVTLDPVLRVGFMVVITDALAFPAMMAGTRSHGVRPWPFHRWDGGGWVACQKPPAAKEIELQRTEPSHRQSGTTGALMANLRASS